MVSNTLKLKRCRCCQQHAQTRTVSHYLSGNVLLSREKEEASVSVTKKNAGKPKSRRDPDEIPNRLFFRAQLMKQNKTKTNKTNPKLYVLLFVRDFISSALESC